MRNTYDKITAYLQENEDILTDCVEQLDSYNGYLGDDRLWEMDALNEFYQGQEPTEILTRAFYGHDADTYNTDSYGRKEYGAFNPNREYFYFNAYGNLVSTNYKDYSDKLDDYLIEELSKNRCWIDAIDNDEYLSELFDELENSED